VIHFLIAHVTVLLIVAFFILFAASRADGVVALFGNILGAWVVIVAVLHVAAFFVPGLMGMKSGAPHGHWIMHMEGNGAPPPMASPVPLAPPAAPAPKKS
jgi:hypothetical protein